MKFKESPALIITLLLFCSSLLPAVCDAQEYKGRPFADKKWKGGAQKIPGRLQCEFYDFGGEGVAYHDEDGINSGSGMLNPADGSYLNEFRKEEGVDISYTKFRNPPIDNTQYNFVMPEKDQLYVGWTKPGEWTRYTVDVKKEGIYSIGIQYTSNKIGKIALSVDGNDLTGPITIPSTYVAADTVAFRQWHHWNYLKNASQIKLSKGKHIITLHTLEQGDMNYDYINFELHK